jgi:hypothetical protein
MEADAYCQYVLGAAESASALLYSPRVFSSFGLMRGYAFDPDGLTSGETDLVLNFRAGVEVSPTRMYTGALIRERARADCEERRAQLTLAAITSYSYDARPALAAKAEVLRAALGAAEEMLAASQAKLKSSLITLQSHVATRMRVESQRRQLADLDAELATLPGPPTAAVDIKATFDALRTWGGRRQAVEARARSLESVDVVLRGGYNEFLSVPQALPVFGSVSVSFVPGRFWQGSAEERSAAGHRDWIESRIERVRASLRESLARSSNQLDIARRELTDVLAVLADLEQRYAELRDVNTSSAQDLIEYLWFDLVRLRADRAYAEARIRTLERHVLGLEDSLR